MIMFLALGIICIILGFVAFYLYMRKEGLKESVVGALLGCLVCFGVACVAQHFGAINWLEPISEMWKY